MINDIEKGQLVSTAIQCFHRADGSLSNFPGLLKKIIREKAWERRIDHRGKVIELPSLRDLITRKFPEGWSEEPAKIESLIRDDVEALVLWREEMTQEPGNPTGSNQYQEKESGISNNVTISTPDRGNSRSYTVARLKQHNPELFQRVVSGELSANAAAIQAGFRKKPSVIDQFYRLWDKASDEERQLITAAVCNQ